MRWTAGQLIAAAPATVREGARRARQSVPAASAFALVFATAVAVSAAIGMVAAEQAVGGRFRTVVVVFAVAGALAGFAAFVSAAALTGHRRATARFAAMLVLLAAGTAAAVALAQFADYSLDENHQNARFFSFHNAYMLAARGASSVYVTLATGLRLILPTGLPALLLGALAFAWWSGRRS